MPINPRQQAEQQYQSLTDRLNQLDAYAGQVNPMVRGQMLDFSSRPAGYNPLQDIASAVEFSERSRDARSGVADQQTDLLGLIAQLAQQEEANARANRQMALEEAQIGAKFNPKTGQYELPKGTMTPEAIKGETDLRKEFSQQVKDSKFTDVRDAYSKVKNVSDTAAGDLSLIFAYMKMLDPGSVVREGEFANAENTAGIPERVRQQYNRALRGERLSKEQRTAFKGEAATIFNSYVERHNSLVDSYTGLASQYGLDPKRIVNQAGKVKPVKIDQAQTQQQPQKNVLEQVLGFVFGGPGSAVPMTRPNAKPQAAGFTIERIE